MKKGLLIIGTIVLTLHFFSSCGDSQKKQEPAAGSSQKLTIDIDTAAIHTPEELFEAVKKFKAIENTVKGSREAGKGYDGSFTVLLKMNTALTKKATQIMKTLPGDQMGAFHEKFKEAIK
jgi:hypothetical protein